MLHNKWKTLAADLIADTLFKNLEERVAGALQETYAKGHSDGYNIGRLDGNQEAQNSLRGKDMGQ